MEEKSMAIGFNLQGGVEGNPAAKTMKNVSKVFAALTVPVTMGFPKEEGLVGLSRGMGLRVLHSACSSAIGYFDFEMARLMILNQYLKQQESSNLYVVPP